MSKVHPVQKYGVAGIADVLSCFGIPTAVASQLYQDILEKRNAEALEILLSEIRQGNFENIDQQDVISILARYQRDAMEGVARNNLRLMARVINGMAEKKELRAPTFLRYASVLSSLTEIEISILAVMMRFEQKMIPTWPNPDPEAAHRHHALLSISINVEEHMQALLRTGLVNMSLASAGYPTQKYQPTSLMKEIFEYADLIIQREAA